VLNIGLQTHVDGKALTNDPKLTDIPLISAGRLRGRPTGLFTRSPGSGVGRARFDGRDDSPSVAATGFVLVEACRVPVRPSEPRKLVSKSLRENVNAKSCFPCQVGSVYHIFWHEPFKSVMKGLW
jgi:hypothetical protein